MAPNPEPAHRFRSRDWFDDPERIGQTALYLERFMNSGLTPKELRSGKPIIGIAQTGSDLTPCKRHHLDLARRVRDGIRDAGGIPLEFPVHPLFENCRRPTAALDRNLAYLGLVELLYGYPIDAVVLTTGCDKTTPSALMAAATVDIPAIVLSGGPMLDGYFEGELVGSGTIVWKSRRRLAAGLIDVAGEFGSLQLNEASRKVLRAEQSVWLRAPQEKRRERRRRGVPAGTTTHGDALFERLRAWRAQTARTAGLPPYVIFHDATLAAIAAAHPESHDDLAGISGVGAKKLERYGDEILRIVQA